MQYLFLARTKTVKYGLFLYGLSSVRFYLTSYFSF